MKRFVALVLALMILAGCCALAETRKVGILAKNAVSEEEYNEIADIPWDWSVSDYEHDYQFFDDLITMLAALNAGAIDEISLPRPIADHIMKDNPDAYEVSCVIRTEENGYAFGFMDDENGQSLQQRFNEAILEMRNDDTLDALEKTWIVDIDVNELKAVEFDSFPDSDETIRVAVTGDIPPVDYISADGTPSGFNTAVLAEIGRRLKVNIELVPINSGARTVALSTGTVDVVFWYLLVAPPDRTDAAEGLLLSKPYFQWDVFLDISRAS